MSCNADVDICDENQDSNYNTSFNRKTSQIQTQLRMHLNTFFSRTCRRAVHHYLKKNSLRRLIHAQDDTVINFLYPLEPPVRFHLWVCFVEQYYLNIKNCFFIYRSYIICYISQRGGNIISREMNLEVAASATLFTPTMNLFTCHVEHV